MRKHPVTGEYKMHNGVDMVASSGKTDDVRCVATVAGTVERVVRNWSSSTGDTAGNRVEIRTAERYLVRYFHLAPNSIPDSVKQGAAIAVGTQLGTCGRTGQVTGVHLHYELRDPKNAAFDPAPYIGNDRLITGEFPPKGTQEGTRATMEDALEILQFVNGSRELTPERQKQLAFTNGTTPEMADALLVLRGLVGLNELPIVV